MRRDGLRFMRTSGLFLTLLIPVVLAAGGCERVSKASAPEGTDFVVFIDFSESVNAEDRGLYKNDLINHVIPTLTAGDRILIAPITDKTLTKFHPLVDVTFPVWPEFNGWSVNKLKYQESVNKINTEIPRLRTEVEASVAGVFSKPFASDHTDIFSSLVLAEKLFHNEPRSKVLIIMSDMIEDYPPYRFDKVSWTPETNKKFLSELEADRLIPDLSGVCVYISGTSADTPEKAGQIATFWQSYFDRAGADMHPSRYAHVLLHWPPAKSCSPG